LIVKYDVTMMTGSGSGAPGGADPGIEALDLLIVVER
jgi:hypothetical protein